MAEWVFIYHLSVKEPHRVMNAKNADEFRQRLFNECPDLKTVWHVADGAKHRDLANPRHSLYAASTAQFLDAAPVRWAGDAPPFSEVVGTALNFWRKWPD